MTSSTRRLIYALIIGCFTMITFNSASYANTYEVTCKCCEHNAEVNFDGCDIYTIKGKPNTILSIVMKEIRTEEGKKLIYDDVDSVFTASSDDLNISDIIDPLIIFANCTDFSNYLDMLNGRKILTCNKGVGIDINIQCLNNANPSDLYAVFIVTEKHEHHVENGWSFFNEVQAEIWS
ncbi:MAG: hypothetical protein KKE11_00500 [Gammaproteobacteria bacterium]|nr:hypothetical protein [Gammaproteobacteria bacterium]